MVESLWKMLSGFLSELGPSQVWTCHGNTVLLCLGGTGDIHLIRRHLLSRCESLYWFHLLQGQASLMTAEQDNAL